MRLTASLSAQSTVEDPSRLGWTAVDGPSAGAQLCALWHHADVWTCREGDGTTRPLAFRLLGPEPVALPIPEPSEAVVSALARILRAVKGSGTLVMLDRPAEAFARNRLHGAEGVRLFGIARDEDLAAWDALLALGLPVYGVRDRLTVEVLKPHPASVISALAYGLFTCDDGLPLSGLLEDRAGLTYVCEQSTTAAVVIRGGFEAATLSGVAGAPVTWKDRGGELVVRLVVRDDQGRTCWTQPRFVTGPRGEAMGHAGGDHHHGG